MNAPCTVSRALFLLVLCCGQWFHPLQARAQADPRAEEILRAARVNPLGQPVTLDARLRSGRQVTPFRIVVDSAISFVFDHPPQTLTLDLLGQSSSLTEKSDGKLTAIRSTRFDERIRGTDITFEDLALKFLYWKYPRLLGEETLRTRRVWTIETPAPRGASQYGAARLWIDQEGGALMRIEGFDMQGRLIRKFEVVSAQKIDGQWMLKQMRIESLNPESGKTLSRTYLEITGKEGAR